MKDFVKWLGVNEKVAKVAVWILIFMVFLIATNTMLESIGFPHYKITYENLVKINWPTITDLLVNWASTLLNFFATVLLVFRINNFKKLFKYSLLYLFLNIIVLYAFDYAISQIFIAIFIVALCYFYSGKNKKYIFYAILSILINTAIQAVTYFYKAKFINYDGMNHVMQATLFSDYFIIMTIIILVKEVYLMKRGEEK